MPKPRTFTEDLFIRVPEGTKERIERLRSEDRQGDFLRRVLLSALADLEAGHWKPNTQVAGDAQAPASKPGS
jgi:hypothetical protein